MSPSNDGCSSGLSPHELRGVQLRRTMSLVTVAWFFGAIWLNAVSGTPLTTFAKALGASPFQFGILAAIPFLASFLTLPGTLFIEATGRRKLIFLTFLYFQRLMWIAIAFVPMWLFGSVGSGIAVLVFLALMFLMHAGNAIGGPAWIGWMADIVLPSVRGAYFSRRRQLGLLTGIPAAWGAAWVLDHFGAASSPAETFQWCTVIFLVACFFGVADIFVFHWVPAVPTPAKKGQHLLESWGKPLHDRNFLRFAGFVGTLTLAVGPMGQFLTLYILHQLGADQGEGAVKGLNQITQWMLIIAPSIAQLLVLPIWGRAADRMGKRPVLALAALGLFPIGLGWCLVTAQRIWLGYVLSALGGALWAGVEIVNLNFVMEFSGSAGEAKARGSTSYFAVNALIINAAGAVGGLLWGAIAEALANVHVPLPVIGDFNYFHVLFILTGVLRLVAVVAFLPHLHEPEARPMFEALRYMGSNMYNNLFGTMMQPFRLIGSRETEAQTAEKEETRN